MSERNLFFVDDFNTCGSSKDKTWNFQLMLNRVILKADKRPQCGVSHGSINHLSDGSIATTVFPLIAAH